MRYTTWHKQAPLLQSWEGNELAEIDTTLVPTIIRDLEPRKNRVFYQSDLQFAIGYGAICKQQEALLMGATDRLIMELRALRGIDDAQPEVYDPSSDPFTLSLGTVMDSTRATNAVEGKLDAVLAKLDEIAAANNGEDILNQLASIAALLA